MEGGKVGGSAVGKFLDISRGCRGVVISEPSRWRVKRRGKGGGVSCSCSGRWYRQLIWLVINKIEAMEGPAKSRKLPIDYSDC